MIDTRFKFEKYTNNNTGKPWIYIKFESDSFRFDDDQKKILKIICNKYFRWDRGAMKWTFPDRGMNEFEVHEYLEKGNIPVEKINEVSGSQMVERKAIKFDLSKYKVEFIDLQGRPLYFVDLLQHGEILVKINLAHWFFDKGDIAEKDVAKKFIISLVGAQLSMTSKQIDFFLKELDSIMFNLKYEYDEH